MDIKLLLIFIIILFLVVRVISPTIRNYLKYKEGKKLEKNIGGFIIGKFYKK